MHDVWTVVSLMCMAQSVLSGPLALFCLSVLRRMHAIENTLKHVMFMEPP